MLPLLVSPPVPLMALASERLSERLMVNLPLFVIAAAPSVPVVLPVPTCSVPAEMVVAPL